MQGVFDGLVFTDGEIPADLTTSGLAGPSRSFHKVCLMPYLDQCHLADCADSGRSAKRRREKGSAPQRTLGRHVHQTGSVASSRSTSHEAHKT